MMFFKILNCETTKNKKEVETEKNQNIIKNNIINNIIKKQRFYNTYEQGHDLSKLNQIKNGMSLSEVKKILGTPISTKKLKNVYFYMNQTFSRDIFGCKFKKGTIVRLYFKDKKLVKIKKIEMKKSLLFFPDKKNIKTNKEKTDIKEKKINDTNDDKINKKNILNDKKQKK